MTVQTLHQEQPTTTDTDDLSHRFCRDQGQAWLQGKPATARCGKTKSDWVPSTGDNMLCVVCWEFYKTGACAHCSNLTTGAN